MQVDAVNFSADFEYIQFVWMNKVCLSFSTGVHLYKSEALKFAFFACNIYL